MNEELLTARIVSRLVELRSKGRRRIWWTADLAANKASPRLLLCLDGRFVAMMVKTDGKELGGKRADTLIDIAKAGGASFVIRSVEDFEAAIGEEP